MQKMIEKENSIDHALVERAVVLFTYSIPSNIIIKERKKVRASEVLSVKHCESLDQ